MTEAEKMSQRTADETACKASKSATPRNKASIAATPTAAICKPVIPALAVRFVGRRPKATSRSSELRCARKRLANRFGEATAKEPDRIAPDWVASISRETDCARGAMTIRGAAPLDWSGATPQRNPFTASKASARGGYPK